MYLREGTEHGCNHAAVICHALMTHGGPGMAKTYRPDYYYYYYVKTQLSIWETLNMSFHVKDLGYLCFTMSPFMRNIDHVGEFTQMKCNPNPKLGIRIQELFVWTSAEWTICVKVGINTQLNNKLHNWIRLSLRYKVCAQR